MRTLKNFCVACIRLYGWVLSPALFALGVRCRFSLSCSQYALQAIEKHGPISGILLALGRLLRCHPFCRGGHDPVPEIATVRSALGCAPTMESVNG